MPTTGPWAVRKVLRFICPAVLQIDIHGRVNCRYIRLLKVAMMLLSPYKWGLGQLAAVWRGKAWLYLEGCNGILFVFVFYLSYGCLKL